MKEQLAKKNFKKVQENEKNARKKRKGDFPYESSIGEIRLKTSPSKGARHALSKHFWT